MSLQAGRKTAAEVQADIETARNAVEIVRGGFNSSTPSGRLASLGNIQELLSTIGREIPVDNDALNREYDVVWANYVDLQSRVMDASKKALAFPMHESIQDARNGVRYAEVNFAASAATAERLTSLGNVQNSISQIQRDLPIEDNTLQGNFDLLWNEYSDAQGRIMTDARQESPAPAEEDDDDEEAYLANLIRTSSRNLPYGAAIPLHNILNLLEDGIYDMRLLQTLEERYPAVAAELFKAVSKEDFFKPDQTLSAQIAIRSLLHFGHIKTAKPYMNGHAASRAESKRSPAPKVEAPEAPKSIFTTKALKLLNDISTCAYNVPVLHDNVDGIPEEQMEALREKYMRILELRVNELEHNYPEVAKHLYAIMPREDMLDIENTEEVRDAVLQLLKTH